MSTMKPKSISFICAEPEGRLRSDCLRQGFLVKGTFIPWWYRTPKQVVRDGVLDLYAVYLVYCTP